MKTASSGPAEHVALNHALDTPRCYVTPRTIQGIVRIAGAADKGNPDGSKANDRYWAIGRAIIASIHWEDRVPVLTLRSHVVKEGFQPGPGGPDIAITELQC